MKYVIVIPDGCADQPQSELDGLTPLQAARLPSMDSVASRGQVGRANHTPAHLTAGSAVANMSLLGYDPNQYFTGRAPLEAAAQGIELGPEDWAIRCNLVTIIDQVMQDFTAEHISSSEARELLQTVTEQVQDSALEFVPGVSYRNLLLYRGSEAPFSNETRSTPPHDLTDKAVADHFPRGPGSDVLSELMSQSVGWFADHPVNQNRVEAGKRPATNLWLWGLGRRPELESFESLYQIRGAMITAVDLLRGLATLVGWQRIEVPGATGYTDTDYRAKGEHAIDALDQFDLVCVHIEAPDEASHEGNVASKVKALEEIDQAIVGPLLEKLETMDAWRMLVTPDHPTLLDTKTHSHGDVPFAVCGSDVTPDAAVDYSESTATASELEFPKGFELMPKFISPGGF
ncbi:MAG: cofactor-independent phosphoglycerate mutase [Mariniblastus sp.]|nr:cofactor-independent phosphoglycerate mutase [Mariniblastus sp.]